MLKKIKPGLVFMGIIICSGYYQYCCINLITLLRSNLLFFSYFDSVLTYWTEFRQNCQLGCVYDCRWWNCASLCFISCFSPGFIKWRKLLLRLSVAGFCCTSIDLCKCEGGTPFSKWHLSFAWSLLLRCRPFRTIPFIIFGMVSKNNMGTQQLCNAVSQFWELPLK